MHFTHQSNNMEASMAVEIRVPSLGESIVDATVATWLKHEGDPVQQGDAIVELETDKVNVEVNAEQSGVLQQVIKKEGENVVVGDVLGIIDEAAETTVPSQRQAVQTTDGRQPVQATASQPLPIQPKTTGGSPPQTTVDEQRPPSALARRIAAEHNIDLSQVKTSSPHGRITKDDVINYLEQQTQKTTVPEPASTAPSTPAWPSLPSEQVVNSPVPAPATPKPAATPALQAVSRGREERVRL